MRALLFPLIFVCLFLASSAIAQTFSVDESKLAAELNGGQLLVEMPVRSAKRVETTRTRLEVLDEYDGIVATVETEQSLKAGLQDLTFSIPLGSAAEKLLWHRFRYSIAQPGSPNIITNTIAMSEIMPEIFELQVTAPHSVFAGMNVRTHVVAIHPYSKKAIRNVEITGNLQLEIETDTDEDELNIPARAKTNAEGVATLDFKVPPGIRLDYDADLTIKGEKNGITRTAEADLEISEDSFVYLYTDKPIYQPGQKLYVRGLYLNTARRPMAEKELEIEIEDEEGETVLEKTVTTSRFGVASIEWQIPTDMKLGKYRIQVDSDDQSGLGLTEFKVSRYDLPNFTVNAKPVKPYYLLDEKTAEVTVDASYLFGKPVQGGTVRIVEERERTWNFTEQEYDTEEGDTYEGTADSDGKFIAKVDLTAAIEQLKKDKWKRFGDVKFAAYFTDATTNRTEQKRFDVRISKEPIHIYFVRPAVDPNPAVPFQFYVSAFYADGSPAKVDLNISGYYDNAYTTETLAKGRTNSYGAAKFEFRFPEKPFLEAKNEFNFRIAAVDKEGNRGTFDETVYVDSTSPQIRIKTDKTIYSPNEPIFAQVISTQSGPVFVEVTKNSSVIWSKQIAVTDGGESITIPYRPDFKGELTITAYSFDGDDGPANGILSKAVIFPTPTELAVDLKGLKDVYRPGEETRLAFTVRNGNGEGVESALGIVLLDKAIEERARVEQLRDNMADLRKLLGTAESFGELRRRDLDRIDTTKPVSNDLQLAAEYLVVNKLHTPYSFSSESYLEDFGSIYRLPMQKRLDPFAEALRHRYRETSEFPNDVMQLNAFSKAADVDLNALRDAWNSQFYFTFRKERSDVIVEARSASADKKPGTSDDFQVTEIRFQWFSPTMNRISKSLGLELSDGPKPRNADELRVLLTKAGIDLEATRDPWDKPVRITTQTFSRASIKNYLETVGNLDGARQEVMRAKAVQQEVAVHNFISSGQDGLVGNYDDFTLGSYVIVLSESDITTEGGKIVLSKEATKNNRGAIGGIITDANGAVIPNAEMKATNVSSKESFEVKSNDEGFFLIANLPTGNYELSAFASNFKRLVIQGVVVTAYNLVNVDVVLEVGAISEVVNVAGNTLALVDASNSALSTSVTKSEAKSISGALGRNQPQQTFTPPVREYFPETLVWHPELITDKNGRAVLDFKMADSLTAWKLYAFGSTESGEFGLVEKEIQTFQPFFAELDPPKILTEADEISLPIPVRNYTNKRQRVLVSMDQNGWSKMLNGSSRQIEIAPNTSQNAVLDFVATVPVTDGKQRVSAIAGKEGDSIEKPVTVKPNGREEIKVQSATFQGSTAFDVNFPAGAFPANRSAILKIYPNVLAHVAESVEGLLQRPHGCGEQTTSSTYPNLMILKMEKDLGKKLNPQTKEKAMSYLISGYKRILNYQTPSGGFSYWGRNDTPNAPLTAYIIQFLTDAETFIDVDEAVVERAKKWLENQQSTDGSWTYPQGSAEHTTAYILRTLLHKPDADQMHRLKAGFDFLEKNIDRISDSYVLANTALIATKLGNLSVAERTLKKLSETARVRSDGVSWTAGSTPFHGWGLAAEIEATAFAVRTFIEFKRAKAATDVDIAGSGNFISGGLKYLLANKDSAGVWHSTQTTVNVLNTLISLQAQTADSASSGDQKLTVVVNKNSVKELAISPAALADPIFIDVSNSLNRDENFVEIKGTGDQSVIGAQLVVTYYNDWAKAIPESQYFDLKVSYDKTSAKIGEEISCSVEMRRKNYTRYGMVLTEIGLPPGADVDRASLEAAKAKGAFSNYDILPDKVVVYSWNASQPSAFSFKFKHRYGVNAQSAPSVVYDYYNPAAQATVAPQRFVVK